MTNEEAINYGEDYLKDLICAVCGVEDKHKEFVKMSIYALEKQINGGWIPCSERLPKIYDDTCTSEIVLVQGYDKEIDYDWQAMGWYAEESKQWYFAECKSTDKPINWINIIAWQPLPEPCKPKED